MKKSRWTLSVALLTVLCGIFLLTEPVSAETAEEELKKKLAVHLKNIDLDTLRPSPITGFYQLEVNAQIVFISQDGKYLLSGDLFDIETQENLSEIQRREIKLKMLAEYGESNMIVIGPKKADHTITVFTDVDCPYCAKLHNDVPALNKGGVKVRYLLYPRNGLNSKTYQKSVAVWCAKDRIEAVGIAKNGGELEMKTCTNPVKAHYELGRKFGVTGTPTIVLDDGRVIGGYMPADRLLALFAEK